MIGSLENGAPLRGGTKAYRDFGEAAFPGAIRLLHPIKNRPRNDDPSIPIISRPFLRGIDMLILHQVNLR